MESTTCTLVITGDLDSVSRKVDKNVLCELSALIFNMTQANDNPWDFAPFIFETTIRENLEERSSNKKFTLELKNPQNLLDIENNSLMLYKLDLFWQHQRGAGEAKSAPAENYIPPIDFSDLEFPAA